MNMAAEDEERMVFMVRNALLVAGQEMGNGEEWPVVKDTIYKIMQDWENLKIERAVSDELQKHYASIIDNLVNNLHLCPEDLRPKAEEMIKELRELYHARFDPVTEIHVDPDDLPMHTKRMMAIVQTLEGKDENTE